MKISKKKLTSLNEQCTLITQASFKNSLGVYVPGQPVEKTIFCGSFSVYESEFNDAAQIGLKVTIGIIINTIEDNGAEIIRYSLERYEVYRRFKRVDGYTEIYLKEVPQ